MVAKEHKLCGEEQVGDLVSKDRALTFHQETSVSGKGKIAGQLHAVMTPIEGEVLLPGMVTGALSDAGTLVFWGRAFIWDCQ